MTYVRPLGWATAGGAVFFVVAWGAATLLRTDSWRYDISDLAAAAAPHPWLEIAGELALTAALLSLAISIRRLLPVSDHRLVATALLAAAALGCLIAGFTREDCDQTRPECRGVQASAADGVHGGASIAMMTALLCAMTVVAVPLNALSRRASTWTWSCSIASIMLVVLWLAVPDPWTGVAQRVLAAVAAAWIAGMGCWLASRRTVPDPAFPRTGDRPSWGRGPSTLSARRGSAPETGRPSRSPRRRAP
jgi:hypothetical protein